MTRVGVLDWGIGGVDALDRLRRLRPDLDLVYHSDAGTTPYGRLSRDALASRVSEVVAGLGVDLVVVACNAASTVLGELDLRVPAIGVIEPGLEAALATEHRVLGLVGGERTIASGVWERPLVRAGRRVVARAAQPLSAHVEAGRLEGP
ncbi:MAG: aspartate/glutamate racemase family protein, partial [Myxococcales bacterium]|nr:aspartate/glutamate racemase family protein [Myxococcales bacterium]